MHGGAETLPRSDPLQQLDQESLLLGSEPFGERRLVGDRDRHQVINPGSTGIREMELPGPPVGRAGPALDDAVALETIDQPDDAALREAEDVCEFSLGSTLVTRDVPEQHGLAYVEAERTDLLDPSA